MREWLHWCWRRCAKMCVQATGCFERGPERGSRRTCANGGGRHAGNWERKEGSIAVREQMPAQWQMVTEVAS